MPDLDVLTLPVLPLTTGVVLPQMVVTIALETDEAGAAAAAATAGDGRLLLVPRVDGRHARVGVIATVESSGTLPSGVDALVVRAGPRARLGAGVVGTNAALWLQAEPVVEDAPTDRDHELSRELKATVRALFDRLGGRRLTEVLRDLDDPSALADAAGWWPDLSLARKVELLETTDLTVRLERVLEWARATIAELELAEQIRTDVAEGMERSQREFLLRQQLAAIRKELGDGDDADDVVARHRARLAELADALPAAVREAVTRDLDKLERGSGQQSTEQGWIEAWLDTVLGLPWGVRTEDRLDLEAAREILDADHHGLEDVKDRIVELLAVTKLRRDRHLGEPGPFGADIAGASPERGQGTSVLLVGPPGVGKTSLGASLARALGRPFVRVALGGVRDEAEIRGHRRTYVGSRAGRLVRALSEAGTMNPVVLLDELDKVGADWRGDPAAALLEVLDPAQNHTFRDHYLEVDLDLSDVLFVATANTLDTIPAALLDRLELVRLDGYTEEEKVAIGRDHLLPRQLRHNGLTPDEVVLGDPALRAVVAGWTREAGVRELERQLGKLLRKVAVGVAGGGGPVVVKADDLPDLLGRRRFDHELADRAHGAGVATGLAVTGAGGDVLFVETTAMELGDGAEPGLTVTGQLGDVMRESAQIALSYVRSRRDLLGIPAGADRRQFHVHFPAGAVPKDGPSAGITMTTALVSLLTGRAVRPDLAMTGEVTLQGRVLPIGGVKQKVLAAHRAGIGHVVLPARNGPDLDDVPAEVLDGLTVHLVDDVAEVLDLALGA